MDAAGGPHAANDAHNPQSEQSSPPRPLRRRKPKPWLRPIERDAFLDAIPEQRDRAIIAVLGWAGVRRNELRLLDRADVDFTSRTLTVRYAKRGKWRVLRLHAIASRELAAYLATRSDAEPALFLSQRRQRIANRTLNALFERLVKAGIVKHMTPHGMRRTFATALHRSSKDLQVVQRAMGHARIETTVIYTQLEDQEVFDAIDQL